LSIFGICFLCSIPVEVNTGTTFVAPAGMSSKEVAMRIFFPILFLLTGLTVSFAQGTVPLGQPQRPGTSGNPTTGANSHANPYSSNSVASPSARYGGTPYSSDNSSNPYIAGSPYRTDSPNIPYGQRVYR
jgi:hypothetical protein